MTPEEELLQRVEAYETFVTGDVEVVARNLEPRLARILASAPRGFPRPQWQGLPVPWISQAEDLGDIDVFRRMTAIFLKLCAVCGLGLGPTATVYVRGDDAVVIDGVAVHPGECARMTERKCPSIRALDRCGALTKLTVPVEELEAIHAGQLAAESGMPFGYAAPHQPSSSAADSEA
jgi:hypothetical protein